MVKNECGQFHDVNVKLTGHEEWTDWVSAFLHVDKG